MNHQSYGWSRRQFLGTMALAGTAAFMGMNPALAAEEPPPETTRLRLRGWQPVCWAPMYVAEPLLREEGFTDIEYAMGPGPKYVEMLKAGTVDLSPSFSALDIFSMEKYSHPVKFLCGMHVGCYSLIGSEKIRSVRDLKGKTVWAGSVENNGPHIFFSVIVAYVGLDPQKDINYAWVTKNEAMQLFREGKIDGFISFPPGPQELMDKKIGRVLVDTNVDRPWSQYFCCMISGHTEFIRKNPVATKRAIRAMLRANDIVARDPELAAQKLMDMKIIKEPERKYSLQALKDIPYGVWREFSPEETIRFYTLRMREIGMIRSAPDEFIDRFADWRFVEQLKNELGMTWV